MFAAGDIGIQADDIGQCHAVFGENRRDIGETKISLRFAFGGNLFLGTDAELARGDHQPVSRRARRCRGCNVQREFWIEGGESAREDMIASGKNW